MRAMQQRFTGLARRHTGASTCWEEVIHGLRSKAFRSNRTKNHEGSMFSILARSFHQSYAAEPEEKAPVVRPSITWGVVGDKMAQQEGRVKVLELLQSKGIKTDEFASVELPTSTEVMLERLDFLKSMGLEINDINEYPLVVCCSVKKNMIPVVNYLEALGFNASQMATLLRKYPMVLHSSVTVDIQPVIIYLMGLGLSRYRIPHVIVKYPDILGFRIEGTMSTSIAYLVSLGVNTREIAFMLEVFPEILGMRVGNNIKVKTDYLRSLGIAREAVGRIYERNPKLLGVDLDEMKERVDWLVKAGVHLDSLPSVLTHYPRLLMMPELQNRLNLSYGWLKREFKISNQDFARMVEKLPQIVELDEKYARSRIQFFVKSGFTTAEVGKMAVSCPLILVLDVDNWMKPSLDYFRKDMKRDKAELVEFPAFFTYGLEERIRFRYRRVAEKGLKWSLAWFLNCSNAKFQDRLASGAPEIQLNEREFLMGGPVEPVEPEKPAEDDDLVDDEPEDETGETVMEPLPFT